MDRELARVGASLSRRLFGGFPPTVGRYRIAGRIGAGGMGQVYRGHDPTLNRPVAIKVLGGSSAANATLSFAAKRDTLIREARALAAVSHPNVVEVYEVGTDEGRVFIAMELIDGSTLGDWISDEHPGWADVVRAYVQAGEGLHAAHQAGLVHRDFKPSNALRGTDDRVRVVDFGLAVASAVDPADEAFAGTPAYMAPECLRGGPATAASDQFSFCVALWQALFDGRPFAADDPQGLRRAIEARRLLRPEKTRVPATIVDALVRGLEPSPDDRWPSMEALLEVLRRPVRRRGPLRALAFATGWVGWKVAAGAILVALFPTLGDADPCEALRTRQRDDWSEGRRGVLQAAFEERGRGSGWGRFHEDVEAQLGGLSTAYAEVCDARRSEAGRVTVDTELACLRRRYVSLQRLLEAVPQADGAQLGRIEDAVRRAGSLEPCAGGSAAQVLPPRLVAAVAESDAKLAEVDVLRTEDRYDEAADILQSLATRAHELRHEPLQARVASVRADVEVVRGDTAAAEDALESVYQLAVGLSDHRLAMNASARLTHLVGVESSRPVEALEWARHSEAAALRLGLPEPRAHLWRVLANVHFNAGQHEQAAALFERAASTLQDDPDISGRERVELLRKKGTVHLHLEQRQQAYDAFGTAMEIAEAEYGPHSHNVAALAFNRGLTTADQAEAAALFQRATRIYAQLWDDHPDLGDALYRWGQALAAIGRPADAESKMREGIPMLAAGIGASHPYVLDCKTSLIELLVDEARFDEAFEMAVSVHADAQANMGDGHPITAGARRLVGAALDGLGETEAARVAYEDAARLSRESPEPDVRMVLRTSAALAEFKARNGEPEEGRVQLEEAAARAREVMGTEHPLWADLQLRALALLPPAEGEPRHLERARVALDVLGSGAHDRGYADAMFSVARLEHRHGDPSRARARAEALAARLRQNPRDAALAAKVDHWLAASR